MDDTEILDLIDGRLDPLVPSSAAPVADLVRRGRARRRRRQGVRAGLAGALAVGVLGVSLTALDRGDDPVRVGPVAPTTPAAAALELPDGFRLVGLGDLAVGVPAGWAPTRACPALVGDLVLAPDDGSCSSSVSLRRSPFPAGPGPAAGETTVNGLAVTTSSCSDLETALCLFAHDRTIAVADLGVTVYVGSRRAVLVEQVAATVQALAAGSVVVPVVPADAAEARESLAATGLAAAGEPAGEVVGTEPSAGSVVPAGSTVTMVGARGSAAPEPSRSVAYDGLAFDVPADWVESEGPCAVRNPGEASPLTLQDPVGDRTCGQSSLVRAFDLDTAVGRSAVGLARNERVIDGLRVLVGSACSPVAACIYPVGRYAVVPDAGVGLLLSGPEGTRPALDRILASLRLEAPDVPAGYRLVGLDGVAAAVPQDWVSCPIDGGLLLRPPGADRPCAASDGSPDAVSLTRVTSFDQPATTEQNGLRVLVRTGCDDTGSCASRFTSSVYAVDRRVLVVAGSASAAVVDTVAASVRPAP